MTRRIAIVGTDTAVGKTSVTCALLRHGRAVGRHLLPFKPAASGPSDEPGDPERLAAAAGLPTSAIPQICPLRYSQPLAPGIAEDPTPFLTGAAPPLGASFVRSRDALESLEQAHRPDVLLVEGAGGLHVPMPDGTWLPDWLRALAPDVVVVGRLGLGTINHTHLTVDALRTLGLNPLGFILVDVSGSADPSTRDNPTVLAHATRAPHLGTMPWVPDPDQHTGWIGPALEALLT